MIDAGIFPAGLVIRAFILNTLIRFRAISADPIVSNGTERARALWRLSQVHVCFRNHRGFELVSVRELFLSPFPCILAARRFFQKLFLALACVFSVAALLG